MNMILHNVTRFTIEKTEPLEDPQILDHGQIRRFDRILANPPSLLGKLFDVPTPAGPTPRELLS